MYGGLATTTSTGPARSASHPGVGADGVTEPQVDPAGGRSASMLRRAQACAGGSSSTATTAGGRHLGGDRERDRPPSPVHRSTTSGRAAVGQRPAPASSIASPATTSVSGRGTKTPGPTASSRSRNGAPPVRCCSGTRRARAATSSSNRPRGRVGGRHAPRSDAPGRARRGVSAEQRGPRAARRRAARGWATPACGQPAPRRSRQRRSAELHSARARRATAGRRRRQPGGLVGVDARTRITGVEVAVQHLVEVVGLVAGAVVGDPVLREVVGADPLGAVDRAHLGAARSARPRPAASSTAIACSRARRMRSACSLFCSWRLLVLAATRRCRSAGG